MNSRQPGKNCIYHADCMEVLRGLPEKSVDLIIADSPYYRMKGDFDFVFQTVPEYLAWCLEWVRECYRVLKPEGAGGWQAAEVWQI